MLPGLSSCVEASDHLISCLLNSIPYLGLSGIENLVHHTISKLIKLTTDMRKGNLIKIPYQLVDSFVNWPEISIFYLVDAVHLINNEETVEPKINRFDAHL